MFSALRKKKTNQLDSILSELVMWRDDPISNLLRQLAENERKLPGTFILNFDYFNVAIWSRDAS